MLRHPALTTLSFALPLLLFGGELVVLAPNLVPHGFVEFATPQSAVALPATRQIPAASLPYRRSGAFLRSGDPVDAPETLIDIVSPIVITTDQISAAAYLDCVADKACAPVRGMAARDDLPATGVSYDDAQDYAAWLSARTGADWRLPTDEEWAFAAGSRFTDDALGIDGSADNPSVRWLAAYQVSANREAPRGPQPFGTYGVNEHGLSDLAGNVWEWTSSCYTRTSLSEDGDETSVVINCGVRIAEGLHRAYISRFIRDAKAGGCSAGIPPELLGFRLVRDLPWWQRVADIVLRKLGLA